MNYCLISHALEKRQSKFIVIYKFSVKCKEIDRSNFLLISNECGQINRDHYYNAKKKRVKLRSFTKVRFSKSNLLKD